MTRMLHKAPYPCVGIFFLAFLLLALSGATQYAHADVGLTIQPVKISETLAPGGTVSGNILLTNASDQDVQVDLSVQDFIPVAGAEGIQFVGRTEGVTTVRDWIKIGTKTPLTFKKGASMEIPYTITAPSDAEPGSHFGVLFFKASVPGDNQQLKVGTQVGVLVLITIPGAHLQKGRIHSFHVPPFVTSGPVPFTMKFENTGTVYFEPKGEIRISNMLGKVVGVVPIEGQVVLPTGMKDLHFDWHPSGLLLGRYAAIATVRDGDGNVLTSEQVHFWAAPLWYMGLFILCVIGLYLLLRFLRRHVRISVR